ncbi:MAG: hypothetical protein AAAC50_07925, partial [Rhizobium altiplani]|uniref:hypothetical protein n=1 Tax=Rhizobium altiplani TaxID=1864509 RepID=UPI0030F157AC
GQQHCPNSLDLCQKHLAFARVQIQKIGGLRLNITENSYHRDIKLHDYALFCLLIAEVNFCDDSTPPL